MANQFEFHNLFQQLKLDPAGFSSSSILKQSQQIEALNIALFSSTMTAKALQQLKTTESLVRAALIKELQQAKATESLVRAALIKELQQLKATESVAQASFAKGYKSELLKPAFPHSEMLVSKAEQSVALLARYVSDSSLTQLIKRFQEVELITKRPDLALVMFEPFAIYTKFAETTVERIGQSKSEKVAKALEVSLHLADIQIVAITAAVSAIAAVPEDDEAVSPSRTLVLLDAQQNELLAAVEAGGDEATLIQRSPASSVAEIAKLILDQIVRCNEVTKAAGKTGIFKPTTRLLEAFKDFVWLLPQNKSTFAEFVDCLYFIFYEGAGKDKLRFLASEGGVLQTNECEFVWCIKYLRNKWLRHDADHGKEGDIKKSWQDLSQKLSWLELKHMPVYEHHFRHLHNRLLEEAFVFLSKVLERLITNTT